MKVGKQFNTLTYGEYLHLLDHHRKFTDFNALGLFHSILEASRLSLDQKLELRRVATTTFPKVFNFLQLKDPLTYFSLSTLGENCTVADERQAWETIRRNQQQLLKHKKLRHRNFGTYSKHLCGYDTCPLNGLMIRQDSGLSYPIPYNKSMPFDSDANRYQRKLKSKKARQDRKVQNRFIAHCLAGEC